MTAPAHPQQANVNPWPHRLAVITAAATLLLIFVGGVVTNTGSGLAVPDWPTTFGYNMFLYPWSKMVGGIFYEHSHRLIGSAVGLLTVALAVSLWASESRRWMRRLGTVALVAVIVQGVLGGLRVVLLEHPLAIVHGSFAQAFFALLTALAVCTSPWWQVAAHSQPPVISAGLKRLALLTAPVLYVQTVAGALLTHTGGWLQVHLLVALVATVCVALLAGKVLRQHSERADLCRPARALVLMLAVQLVLGLGAFVTRFAVVDLSPLLALALPAMHRITGALVLATAVVLGLRLLRLSRLTEGVVERVAVQPASFSPLGTGHGQQVTA